MHSHWFVVLILFTYLLSTAIGETPTLVPGEVEVLKEIAKTLGKTDWNFTVDPCSGLKGWATLNPVKYFENNVSCNCSITGCHVTGIMLKSQNLPGVLPPELVKLPFIELIDLSLNYLSGTIPVGWGSMKLVSIILLGNRLTGPIPKEITKLAKLTDLVLDMNHFSGPIPPELGNMQTLQKLIITSNNFSGPLPEELAKLTELKELRISDNQFTGKMPDFIGSWTKLEKLAIQASGLEGPIPSSISQLSRITEMRISDLSGPEATFPSLSNLKTLKNLILRSCNIIGEIPAYFGDITTLRLLDLSFNKLSGKLPESFNGLSPVRFMYLSGNLLTGDLPDWMIKTGKNVDLSYNNFKTKKSNCQQNNVNLFGSSLLGKDSGIVPCLKSVSCPKKYYSMNINCGGKEIIADGNKTFGEDLYNVGASRFIESKYNWAFSSTGHFYDNAVDQDNYIAENNSRLSLKDAQLYTTARLSPNSLTYYGYCMGKGNYTVNLHFVEIQFTSGNTFSSLGRRIFDVYIQGKRVLKDFNIESEAGGPGKVVIKHFTTTVHETLEIRLSWTGKGTLWVPTRGVYGPLISAISVDPDFNPLSENGKKISVGAIAGIVVSVLLFIFFILAFVWWKGCLRRKTVDQELKGVDPQIASFTLRQIKAATNNFDAENKIGEGGFGSVYRGYLSDGRVIAVKQLSSKSKQGHREFLNEIGMISALQNPHLVKLYGCCTEGSQLLLVYEYLENNSLARALFGPTEFQIKLKWRTRQKICVGLAKGLAYLHEESRLKIVHRDIKATNVLLDKDLNPKISDFGIAKLADEGSSHISTRIAGTFGYIAPEYAMRGYLSDKADVYSFGVVAMEIVSGRSNTNDKARKECVYLLDWAMVLQQKGDLMELVDPRLGSDYIKVEVMRMINVALACTNAASTLRPTMSSVVSILEGEATVPTIVSAPNVPLDDSSFKDILRSYREIRDQSLVNTRDQIMFIEGPWTGSPPSDANDVYPLKLNSQYWDQRD